jgi:hypothetical protein
MSNQDRYGRGAGPAVNQVGTPVNQLGTPQPIGAPQQPGTPVNQFGTPLRFGGQQPFAPAAGYHPPAPARSGTGWIVAVAALAVVVVAGFLVRTYVFPDLSKPIELPGTVAGVTSMGAGTGQPVTMQSKDHEGRATAVGVYADDPTTPSSMVVVTAGRVKNLGTQQITEATTTAGKVTCTDNVATGTLLAQAGATAGPGAAAMRGLTTGSACWRTSRHLTVLVVALTAHEAAQSTARQAVQEAWDAI